MIVDPPNATQSSITDRGRRRWHFAGAVLDERTFELLVNGVDAELERKPLEVLMFLLQHPGEVCTKDELLGGVWPGRILSETVLTKCIGRLREVLGDRDQGIIKTAYGFGYRFVAPVTIERVSSPEPARFDFRPGDHPPGRPLWSLVERLGVGGHGEAWRGRHEKTHEQRVFKFALDEVSLGALKREITLFRIINDSLEERARIVKLLDWNLEQAPYFTEAEYLTGGSLVDWARSRGGVAAIPLAERLEVVAKIATALAAVHSVGVLHKDLKPTNVLVNRTANNPIDIALSDFGSGGVLDADQLERLGITRLGFTKTISVSQASSGTPMYLAPEILAGQPFTVKSDIYALGVILYQFLTGDFHKVMSPGWERDIDDELLREDVALIAEGNPAIRLADADVLAQRLRTLDKRRAELLAQRETQAKAERARRLLERARARRFGLIVAFVVLIAGLTASVTLYFRARHAQKDAEAAAAQSKAVTEFLSKDVFAPVSSGAESVKTMTVIDLLTRAGNQVDSRFAAQPEVASELNYVIGRSFDVFYEAPLAAPRFARAFELGQQLHGVQSEPAIRSAAELVNLDYVLGKLPTTIVRYETTLKAGEASLDRQNMALLTLRQKLAWGHFKLGRWTQSAPELEAVIANTPRNDPGASEFLGRSELYLGQVLTALARPTDARPLLRSAIVDLTQALSDRHAIVSEARGALGLALADSGNFSEAQAEIDRAEELAVQWTPPGTWTIARPLFYKGLLFLHMDEPAEAESLLDYIIVHQDTVMASRPELDHTGSVRQALGESYLRQGKVAMAITTLQKAVAISIAADGAAHPSTQSIRLSLAEALLANGKNTDARQALMRDPAIDLAGLPAVHPFEAQLQRVDGLLALHSGDKAKAREFLGEAQRQYEILYGNQHWRAVRARLELQSAQ